MAGPRARKSFTVSTARPQEGERIVLYGTGGIGKSTLAVNAPAPVAIDAEGSLNKMDVPRIPGVQTYQDLRDVLTDHALFRPYKTIIVDTMTAVQEWGLAHTIRTIKHPDGKRTIDRIEDYGFGKGYRFLYDVMCDLLTDFDTHVRAGRNIILVCHETTAKVPNPAGDDYLQYQPALLQNGQDARFRDRLKNWADHVLYVQYDRFINDDGKAQGSGSRTIYAAEQATFWAKSRLSLKPIVFTPGSRALWDAMFPST
jgi:energy-coupling factor transporter ATP-binding protein EcfA2